MIGRRVVPGLFALVLGACGAGDGGERSLSLTAVTELGVFLPANRVVELGRGAGPADEAYWEPEALATRAGWGRADRRGRWLRGERAGLLVSPTSRAVTGLRFELDQEGFPEAVEVSLAGGGAERTDLSSGGAEVMIRPEGPGPWDLEIAATGSSVPGGPGVRLRSLALVGAIAATDAPAIDPERELVAFRAPGALVVPVRGPAGAVELALDLETGGGAALDLHRMHPAGPREQLGHFDRSGAVRLPWPGDGALHFLVLDGTLEASSARLAIRGLRLEARPVPPVEPARESRRRPDVVVFLLDAARADHLSCYGYARPTTPVIDRIAGEGLVFGRVYSECASTSCSVPNMISGLAFLDRGDERKAKRIPDEVETLAELLREEGYRTVGYSANPNNSKARNTDQGFDEFWEMWRPLTLPDAGTVEAEGRAGRDPHRLSRLAAATIAALPSDQPLFLFLHYVPPHEPYDPLPEFDRFGDPGYDGIVTGDRRVTRALRADELELDEADIAELVALYDGNLLMADDAVGSVLAALEAAGRFDDAILLVTADHGEAFLEHGRQGHNSTLFDEMLHVPFVLRLPDRERPQGVDLDRLGSLSDLVPTLLGRLGLEPPSELAGVDLVSSPVDPSRILFHRTNSAVAPMFAARSDAWKALAQPGKGGRALFDLRHDPAETRDQQGDRPWLYAGLMGLLRQQRALADRRSTADDAELSPEDAATLEALGYL